MKNYCIHHTLDSSKVANFNIPQYFGQLKCNAQLVPDIYTYVCQVTFALIVFVSILPLIFL